MYIGGAEVAEEREKAKERRNVARLGTSAGLSLSLSTAGGQTGCPDSTEGRLLCLPRVATDRLEPPPPLRPYFAKTVKREREKERGDTCTHTRERAFTRRYLLAAFCESTCVYIYIYIDCGDGYTWCGFHLRKHANCWQK